MSIGLRARRDPRPARGLRGRRDRRRGRAGRRRPAISRPAAECRAEVAAHYEALASLAPHERRLSWRRSGAACARGSEPRRPTTRGAPLSPSGRVRGTLARGRRGRGRRRVRPRHRGRDRATAAREAPLRRQRSSRLRPQVADVRGQAELFAPESTSGRLVLELEDVPDAPAGHHYAVWVLRPGDRRRDGAGGGVQPAWTGARRLELPLPGRASTSRSTSRCRRTAAHRCTRGTSLAGAIVRLVRSSGIAPRAEHECMKRLTL